MAGDPSPVPTPARPPVFHVFVNLSNLNRVATEYPGLVLGWRRGLSQWEAHVVYVTPTGEDVTAHVTWVEASRLRPHG